ncbi:MAG: Gfo/Idh/MocA family oxidoreductase [Desulfurococcaceae archaeon]
MIGCGAIAKTHVDAWRKAGAKVVSICDSNVYLAKSRAFAWRVPRWYEDVSTMIEHEDLNAVSICTPPNVRLSVFKPVAETGVHAVVEKPFAITFQEACEMSKLAKKYGTKVSVVHSWVFSYIMRKIMKYLGNDYVGDIASINLTMLHTRNDPMVADPSHWSHRIQAGRFGESLPHPIYTFYRILGKIQVKCIYGVKMAKREWMPIDELKVLFENDKHQIATAHISFNSARPETTLNILGTDGILCANLTNNVLLKKRGRNISPISIGLDNLRIIWDTVASSIDIMAAIALKRYEGMHTEFIKRFVKSIVDDIELPVTDEEALNVVKTYEEVTQRIHSSYYEKAV